MGINNSKNYIDLSDEELVILIRNSDEYAFKVLYERYLPKIRTMTYSFQGLGYDVDDLVQEQLVFLQLLMFTIKILLHFQHFVILVCGVC